MRHWLRVNCLILLALAMSCASNPKSTIQRADDPTVLIERGRLFNGSDGVKVEMIELKEPGKALVRVTGVRSEQADKVFEHRVNENGRRLEYITQIDGRDQYTLVRTTPLRGGDPSWRLYMRGAGFRGMDIEFDEEASEKLDVIAMYRMYEEQRDTGVLEAVQRFERDEEEKYVNEKLAEELADTNEACKTNISFSVDWSTIDDDTLKEYSITGYCEHVLEAIARYCEDEPGRRFAKANIDSASCRFGDEMSLVVADKAAVWTTNREGSNMSDFTRDALGDAAFEGSNLRAKIALGNTQVCTDDAREHFVMFAPDGSDSPGMHYGDAKQVHPVPTPQLLSGGWFFEPRHYNEGYNSSFRGMDLRVFSKVETNAEEGTCEVTCGTHTTALNLLPNDEMQSFVEGVEVVKAEPPRIPHALARDRRGIYYLVDRSQEPGRERDFRLYVGPLGNLKRQSMRNVVSDSEGEIFSSKAGELRFILGAEDALWITGKRQRKLLKVPIEDNWNMIYNRLGVYFGAKLGNPCDDFGIE